MHRRAGPGRGGTAARARPKLGSVAQTQRVQLPNGIGLTVSDQGEGPAVLLNPGMGMPQTTWEFTGVPQGLREAGFRVISYSARGVTGSDAPPPPYDVPTMAQDAALLLDHCGVDEAILVGYSMGCYVTQALLEARPGLARGVVLCAGLASSQIGRLVNEMELELIERLGDLPAAVAAFETLITTLPAVQLQDAETVRVWQDMLLSGPSSWTSPAGRHGQLAASQSWMVAGEPTRARLAAIDVPTLVIAYEQDLFFPPKTSLAAAELIPDAEFVAVNGLAHGGLMLDPDRTATARIVDFCRRIRSGDRPTRGRA